MNTDGLIILAAQVVTQAHRDAAQGDASALAWLAPLTQSPPANVRFVRQPGGLDASPVRCGPRWRSGEKW